MSTVALGCRASTTGGNLSIPISSSVGEGATIVVAIQVVARNEDITSVSDLSVGGNTYTRLVKHLGILIGPVGNQENDTLHLYAAADAKALNSGQPINIVWNFSNSLEACAVAVYSLHRTPFDQSAASHASSANPNSGNTLTTALANEVLVGAFGWFCHQNGSLCNANATPGSGYSEIIEGEDVMIAYRTVNAIGAYNAGATLNLSSDWNAGIVTFKVDSTAPVVTSTLAGTLGNNGWYRSNVVVSWNVTDPESRVITTCNPTTISTDTTGTSVSCQATSAGGTTSGSITVKRDTLPPTITAAGAPAPNASGWNNSDVTVTFTCSDATSGLAGSCPANQVLSSEGATVSSSAQTVSDQAGNQGSTTHTVSVDKTAPTVTVTGVSDNATYTLGSVPTAGCSTTDALSGVATQATLNLTGGNPDGTGSFTATCSGATDVAGNSAASVSVSYTVTPPPDNTAPVITPNVVGTLGNNGWYGSDVTVSWTVVDDESPISNQSGCETQTITSDTPGVTLTCSATSSGGSNSQSVTLKRDATAPTLSAAASSAPNANGWYNSNVTVQFTCNDNLSGVVSCPAAEVLSSEGAAVSATAQTITDQAGNSSAASNVVTVQIDKTAPVVSVTGISNGANYTLGSVPTAACSTTDALSGVATQATASVTGGNGDGTGNFTATCSGAVDNAGNNGSASVSYTVSAPVDACTTTALRDNFNRANGGLGSNWAGVTGQSFYKVANNGVDVQLGGPVVWKPTTFGANQAAFVTLSTLDGASPSQGLLLKVQGSTIPNAGAIAVVYDNLAKAVRVSTLRLNTPTWTVYGNTPATFANGDKLIGCVQANGTVRVYKNNSLLTTVTLNAADQSFFNAKGGKIGLWTVAAPNAFVDDFGGGVLTSVVSATLDANAVADELADDGAEITVAVDFPTDEAAPATPDADTLVNRAFLPLVSHQ